MEAAEISKVRGGIEVNLEDVFKEASDSIE